MNQTIILHYATLRSSSSKSRSVPVYHSYCGTVPQYTTVIIKLYIGGLKKFSSLLKEHLVFTKFLLRKLLEAERTIVFKSKIQNVFFAIVV